MNEKSWNDLKSRRDLWHRTKRRKRQAGLLQQKRQTPHMKWNYPRSAPKPIILNDPKPKEQMGIAKRIWRRLIGQ